jgi:hypothetical protein
VESFPHEPRWIRRSPISRQTGRLRRPPSRPVQVAAADARQPVRAWPRGGLRPAPIRCRLRGHLRCVCLPRVSARSAYRRSPAGSETTASDPPIRSGHANAGAGKTRVRFTGQGTAWAYESQAARSPRAYKRAAVSSALRSRGWLHCSRSRPKARPLIDELRARARRHSAEARGSPDASPRGATVRWRATRSQKLTGCSIEAVDLNAAIYAGLRIVMPRDKGQ